MSELVHADGSKYKIFSCCYSGLHLIVLDKMLPWLVKFDMLTERDLSSYRSIARRCISWSYGDEIARNVMSQTEQFYKVVRESDQPLTEELKRLKKQYRI